MLLFWLKMAYFELSTKQYDLSSDKMKNITRSFQQPRTAHNHNQNYAHKSATLETRHSYWLPHFFCCQLFESETRNFQVTNRSYARKFTQANRFSSFVKWKSTKEHICTHTHTHAHTRVQKLDPPAPGPIQGRESKNGITCTAPTFSLQCLDTVGWVTGRASGL